MTELPGLFVPDTVMLLAAIAVPLAHAWTEVAFRSPIEDVMVRAAVLEPLSLVMVLKVGTVLSTSTVYAGETVVLPALSVTLNATVFKPAFRTIGTVQTMS